MSPVKIDAMILQYGTCKDSSLSNFISYLMTDHCIDKKVTYVYPWSFSVWSYFVYLLWYFTDDVT